MPSPMCQYLVNLIVILTIGGGREFVIDFEFLRGRQNETVVKELSVASANAAEMFRF